jgi:hypothetical protein
MPTTPLPPTVSTTCLPKRVGAALPAPTWVMLVAGRSRRIRGSPRVQRDRTLSPVRSCSQSLAAAAGRLIASVRGSAVTPVVGAVSSGVSCSQRLLAIAGYTVGVTRWPSSHGRGTGRPAFPVGVFGCVSPMRPFVRTLRWLVRQTKPFGRGAVY